MGLISPVMSGSCLGGIRSLRRERSVGKGRGEGGEVIVPGLPRRVCQYQGRVRKRPGSKQPLDTALPR